MKEETIDFANEMAEKVASGKLSKKQLLKIVLAKCAEQRKKFNLPPSNKKNDCKKDPCAEGCMFAEISGEELPWEI